MGSHNAYSYDKVAAKWISGGANFVNQVAPAYSKTGRVTDVVHYAQVVWRSTTTMGCGIATDGHYDYVVCRYEPAGNVMGERAY